MATKECDPRIEAIKETFRKNFDKLRTELKSNIQALNSKLLSRGLITDEVWSKHHIDDTLSAIRARLQDGDVTEYTFTQFCDAVSEISTHLKTMLSKALSKELKEEPVVSVNSYYATPAIPDSFASGNLPGGPAVSSLEPGSSLTKEPADLTARKDSALYTNSVTDGEELPGEFHPYQVTDQGDLTVHMDTASGTWPTLESNLKARVLALEKLVSELEATIEQLEQDKLGNLKLARGITTDISTQLNTALGCLQIEQERTKELRQKLYSLKKEKLDIEQEYNLLFEQKEKVEKAAEIRASVAWETSSNQIQLAVEDAAEQIRIAQKDADEKVRFAKEEAAEQVRQAKKEADEKVRLAEEEAAEQVRLAKIEANEKVRLAEEEMCLKVEEHAQEIQKHYDMHEQEKLRTREAEERARLAEKQNKEYKEGAERFAELQRFVEQHLRIVGEKLNSINI